MQENLLSAEVTGIAGCSPTVDINNRECCCRVKSHNPSRRQIDRGIKGIVDLPEDVDGRQCPIARRPGNDPRAYVEVQVLAPIARSLGRPATVEDHLGKTRSMVAQQAAVDRGLAMDAGRRAFGLLARAYVPPRCSQSPGLAAKDFRLCVRRRGPD